LKSSKAEILDLRAALSSYAEEITVLEHRIEELQYKFGEKVRRRDARIEQLDLDLKEKSTAVANLTQQLHQTHIRLEAVAENDATVQYSTGGLNSTKYFRIVADSFILTITLIAHIMIRHTI